MTPHKPARREGVMAFTISCRRCHRIETGGQIGRSWAGWNALVERLRRAGWIEDDHRWLCPSCKEPR